MNRRILIFDYETNGFLTHAGGCQPIQYCFKIIEEGGDVDIIQGLVKCSSYISKGASDVHGLTLERVNDEGIELREFKQMAGDIFHGDLAVIVGHNIIKFDIPVNDLMGIATNLKRVYDTAGQVKAVGLPIKRDDKESMYDYHNRALSTPRKGLKFNLGFCLNEHKLIPVEGNAHDATVDVLNTELLFRHLCKDNEKLNTIVTEIYGN